MKRKTRLIALCCVLVAAVGAAVGGSLYTERAEQIAESGEVVFELPVDEVTSLAWSTKATTARTSPWPSPMTAAGPMTPTRPSPWTARP